MATKTKNSMTFAIEKKPEEHEEECTTVFIPALESDGQMKVDQYEHVTIANEEGEKITYIKRGEPVGVSYSVFKALREKYPKI